MNAINHYDRKADYTDGAANALPRSTPAPRALYPALRSTLFSLDLVRATLVDSAKSIVDLAVSQDKATIQFINAHCVNLAIRDASYREALGKADLLLPDGSGIAIAARLAGVPMGENLNGTDLFPLMCEQAAQRGQSIFLLGGKPDIAARAANTMRSRYPSLQIAGTRHGFWHSDEEDRLIDEINGTGAAILLVGLGVPVQEKWIARVRDRLTARIVIGVGGLFDYYSGAIPRAPLLIRTCGCEWIWRLIQEPKRLFGRYILGNPKFLWAALKHGVRQRELSSKLSRKTKRFFDIAATAPALLCASPLFLLVALAIKIEDRGPVFFRQTRIGDKGHPFRMWKFRSMVVDAEQRLAAIKAQSERDGTCFKMKRDPRVTRVGALLRRLSLDELPQLFNILTGEMSIVGPRPALPREVITYAPKERERLFGMPGLTCTWQVSGRAEIPFEQQVQLDIDYLKGRSMVQDCQLILKTIPAVLTARGAY